MAYMRAGRVRMILCLVLEPLVFWDELDEPVREIVKIYEAGHWTRQFEGVASRISSLKRRP